MIYVGSCQPGITEYVWVLVVCMYVCVYAYIYIYIYIYSVKV